MGVLWGPLGRAGLQGRMGEVYKPKTSLIREVASLRVTSGKCYSPNVGGGVPPKVTLVTYNLSLLKILKYL